MSVAETNPVSLFQRPLDGVERLGNNVPHPAVLFLLLIAAIALLSHVLYWMGIDASYQRINLETYELETTYTAVNSLLSSAGIRFVFTSVVANFVRFGPVGIILVAMIGVGLAERGGCAAVHEARGGARGLPGERFPAERDQPAAAALRAGGRVRAAIAARGRRRHRGGDDAAVRGRDDGRVGPAVHRVVPARAAVRSVIAEPAIPASPAPPPPGSP